MANKSVELKKLTELIDWSSSRLRDKIYGTVHMSGTSQFGNLSLSVKYIVMVQMAAFMTAQF